MAPPIEGVDGLVLSAVVLEEAPDIRDPRDQEKVADQEQGRVEPSTTVKASEPPRCRNAPPATRGSPKKSAKEKTIESTMVTVTAPAADLDVLGLRP